MTMPYLATPSKAAAYQANSVGTASPVRLVGMLYDGALTALGRAQAALAEQDLNRSHMELVRCQEIVAELAASLDLAAGGEVAQGLASLYEFAQRQLIEANIRKSSETLGAVVGIFEELRAAWATVVEPAQ